MAIGALPRLMIVALGVGAIASGSLAGDLNPPPGPIEPTMKPIDALMPGRCVGDLPGSADAVHVISEPGLYVLTGDVVSPPGRSAIVVDLNPALGPGEYRVSIDLAGHQLLGDPGSLHGIEIRASAAGSKGKIEVAWKVEEGTSRVAGFGGSGIQCDGDHDLSVSRLAISSCGGHGIECTGASRLRCSSVEVSSCTGDGVHVSSVERCELDVTVTDCGGDGIEASFTPVVHCVAIKTKGTGADKNRVAGCGGHGFHVTDCDDLELVGYEVSHCALDGVHVTGADECRLALDVHDCDGDGIDVSATRRLSACCIGSSGEDGVEVRVARCDGHGVHVTGVDEVDLSLFVEQCLQDGVHVSNVLQCDLDVSVHGCGGDGIEGTSVARMAIGSKGMPTTPRPKGTKSAHRVVAPGGNGVVLTACAHVTIGDLECTDATLSGIVCDVTGVPGDSSVTLHALRVARCGGDAIRVLGSGASLVSPKGIDVDSVTGDGLHVQGASLVDISDWRDNDCDDDGIEIVASAVTSTRLRVEGSLSLGAGDVGLRLHGPVNPVHAELHRVTVRDAFGNGIDARNTLQLGSLAVEDCLVTGCGGDGLSCDRYALRLFKVTCDDNGACGMRVSSVSSVTASSVHAENNGEEGMRCAGSGGGAGKVSMQDFHFVSNGFALPGGAPGCSIEGVSSIRCQNGECSSNAGDGLRLGDFDRDGMLDLVVCSSNVADGIHATSLAGLPLGRCRVTNAMCDSNGGHGIFLEATTGGEVSRCTVTSNSGLGIFVLGNGHTVHSNSCSSNLGGPLLVPVPGNVLGPLVDELSVGGNCNPAANYVQ